MKTKVDYEKILIEHAKMENILKALREAEDDILNRRLIPFDEWVKDWKEKHENERMGI